MRKLIKIEHERCSEWDGSTYLWGPENLTQEQLEKDIDIAQENYLKAKEDFLKTNEKPDYYSSHLDKFPDDMTIKQAKELIKKQDENRKIWNEEERKASRSFATWMRDLGYSYLVDAEDDEIMEGHVYWGHRHGMNIEYGVTNIDVINKSIKKENKIIDGKLILKKD